MARSRKALEAAGTGTPASVDDRPAKLVRDSFTMPADDFALVGVLKGRALRVQRPAKKSELLRAGVALLAALNDEELMAVIGRVERIKTGRPSKK